MQRLLMINKCNEFKFEWSRLLFQKGLAGPGVTAGLIWADIPTALLFSQWPWLSQQLIWLIWQSEQSEDIDVDPHSDT